MQIQMYGALFLMTGPYALAQGAHVRGDFLYRLYPVKWQATSDFILYVIFFVPGMFALVYAGYTAASESWRFQEVSLNSPAGIQIYYLKSLIPVVGFLMLLQGFSEMLRCWKAMRTGVWMPRLNDVKETEDLLADTDPDLLLHKNEKIGEPGPAQP
jgi:TRAP-type mannitol/chloroaromatic compound transport system permease small subunit